MYFDETIKKIESSLEKLEELDKMLMTLKTVMDELMDSADLPESAKTGSEGVSNPENKI